MTVYVRADASAAIGTGHVYRCLALADLLERHGRAVTFVCRRFPGDLVEAVRARGFPVLELGAAQPGDGSWLGVPLAREIADAQAVLAAAERPPGWVVVDHYELDARWEAAVRRLGPRVLALDDLADRPHAADVVLDATPGGPERYAGRVAPGTRLLLGPRFALVRDGFVRVRERPRPRTGAIARVLVFYGGIDATNETAKALRALRAVRADLAIDVVLGPAAVHRAAAAAEAALDRRARVCGAHEDMAELMASADLALGAGGSASWERCFAGLPALVTAVAPNQVDVARRLARAGAAVALGSSAEVDERGLAAAVERLRADPSAVRALAQAAAALVAGYAGARAELLAALAAAPVRGKARQAWESGPP